MSSTQKVAFLDSQGGEFSVRETSIPKPGPGQLLVRIEAAGLTPADWKLQKYGYYIESWPTVIGLDLSGVVAELGEGVNRFAKGDRVFSQGFWTEGRGAFQQYAVIDAEVTAKIPSKLSFAQAATLPTAVAAVVIGLYLPQPQGVGLTPPFESDTRGQEVAKSILIPGGAGIVGQIAIQFAKLSGFSFIFTTASLKYESYLKSLGATHVFDRNLSTEELHAEIQKVSAEPIKVVFDALSSPETQATVYTILAEGGSIVLLDIPAIELLDSKPSHRVFPAFVGESKELGIKLYRAISGLLEAGEIKTAKVEVLPGGLNGIADGVKRLELNQVFSRKLVVQPQETA